MVDRRAFITGCAAGAVTVSLAWPGAAAGQVGASPKLDARSFRDPPAWAKPHTWWHWINGNATKDGITRDLEAMARVGVGGVQMFDVGVNLPKGPAAPLSPLWLNLVRHAAAECDRLGIAFTMHNCPGWSSSGGPWITPALGMQQLVWSETAMAGGAPVDVVLPQPLTRLSHYRDAMTIAFPSLPGEDAVATGQILRASINGKPVETRLLVDGDAATAVDMALDGKSGTLTLEFAEPRAARSILVQVVPESETGSPALRTKLRLEASQDGRDYLPVCEIDIPVWRLRTIPPLGASFAETRARFFRLVGAERVRVAEVRLSDSPRLANWIAKAGWGRAPNLGEADAQVTGPAIDPASILDISGSVDAGGRLRWTPPPGNWTVLRFGHTATGARNVSPSDDGSGLECDKFSKAALDFHFHKYFGELRAALAPLGKRHLAGALIDSYETGMQNWSAGFADEFARRRGYPILRYMPALTGRVVGSSETSERFLWDFRRAQALVMEDHYFGRFHELCREYGLISYTEPYGNGPYDDMQGAARVDALMGEFWIRSGAAAYSVKLAATAAHVHGKRFVGAESFTGRAAQSRWMEHPYAMKALGDEMYTLGLNHFIFHRYAQQPHPTAKPGMTMGPWGFHFDRTNTWFEAGKPWLEYAARCQHLLTRGTFAADILYFAGESSPVQVPVDVDEPVAATLSGPRPQLPQPCPRGYDYDVCDAQVLLERAAVRAGRIVLPDGISYRVLVMPDERRITRVLLVKLRELVRAGAWIIGPRPERSHGLGGFPQSDGEVRQIAAELWGDLDGKARRERAFGKGRVFWGMAIADVLAKAGVSPDVTLAAASPDPALHWIHRRDGDADIYFVANAHRRGEDVLATFRVAGKQPEIWDAETGQAIDAPVWRSEGGRTQVALKLDAAQSCFVVFRRAAGRAVDAITRDGQQVFATAAPVAAAAANAAGSFTLTGWIKPETDLWPIGPEVAGDDQSPGAVAERVTAIARSGSLDWLGTSGGCFLMDPPAGDTLYGAGHANAALTAGRNGFILYENSRAGYPAVLTAAMPVAGWTHIALVYDDNVPALYVAGRKVATGKRSRWIVHSGLGLPVKRARLFEGDAAALELVPGAMTPAEIARRAAARVPAPDGPSTPMLTPGGMLVWENGRYGIGTRMVDVADIAAPTAVAGAWDVRFPPDLGAPASVQLPELRSLRHHADSGVRHFSGTATWRNRFTVPADALGAGKRLLLDLGRVEVIAAVRINGRSLGSLWKPPFRIDITDAVHAGENALEVDVTSLWPNRLIGDEQLPPENAYRSNGAIERLPGGYREGRPKPPGGRTTFATWRHFTADAPLLESGLLGPVTVRSARILPWA